MNFLLVREAVRQLTGAQDLINQVEQMSRCQDQAKNNILKNREGVY